MITFCNSGKIIFTFVNYLVFLFFRVFSFVTKEVFVWEYFGFFVENWVGWFFSSCRLMITAVIRRKKTILTLTRLVITITYQTMIRRTKQQKIPVHQRRRPRDQSTLTAALRLIKSNSPWSVKGKQLFYVWFAAIRFQCLILCTVRGAIHFIRIFLVFFTFLLILFHCYRIYVCFSESVWERAVHPFLEVFWSYLSCPVCY